MAARATQRIKATDIRKKLREQNCRCSLTGDELTPDNLTADHGIPVSRGGAHEMENIFLVTATANAAKGTLLLPEFVALCRKVVAHADATQPPIATAVAEAESLSREWLS